jgi:fructose-bisphosphate aldolase, class I
VILYDETIRQSTAEGVPFTEILTSGGVIPGIKVDTGAKPLALFPGEMVTEGLDGLRERLEEYRGFGARFAKWRAVITIGDGTPTDLAIHANAHAMARYAALCQEADIVPIVEPETLMDGDHDIGACENATARTLDALYEQMSEHRLDLGGTLLKVNMVVPGKGNARQDDDRTIAEATIRTLRAHVPDEVPGVVFLSGGMSDEQATSRLNEMNRIGGFPWELSFSYGRALQAPALSTWNGDDRNAEAGQKALAHRARMNGLARDGRYEPSMESAA